jgi:hypothetical protein
VRDGDAEEVVNTPRLVITNFELRRTVMHHRMSKEEAVRMMSSM